MEGAVPKRHRVQASPRCAEKQRPCCSCGISNSHIPLDGGSSPAPQRGQDLPPQSQPDRAHAARATAGVSRLCRVLSRRVVLMGTLDCTARVAQVPLCPRRARTQPSRRATDGPEHAPRERRMRARGCTTGGTGHRGGRLRSQHPGSATVRHMLAAPLAGASLCMRPAVPGTADARTHAHACATRGYRPGPHHVRRRPSSLPRPPTARGLPTALHMDSDRSQAVHWLAQGSCVWTSQTSAGNKAISLRHMCEPICVHRGLLFSPCN